MSVGAGQNAGMTGLDCETLWSALPIPALLIDPEGQIMAANPPAEAFFNASQKLLAGAPLKGLAGGLAGVEAGSGLGAALARVREERRPVFVHKAPLAPRGGGAVSCDLHLSLLEHDGDEVLLLIEPGEMAGRLGQGNAARAARSAIGMAEMLAHEIKNPLAGITGAAQLLSMSLGPEDRELTSLIVAESRRIVALLEQVEQFGNLRPPERKALNLHDLLEQARRSAAAGFARNLRLLEAYDPSLPPTWVDGDQMVQVFLNLLKNAAEALGADGTITLRTSYDHALRLRRPDGTEEALPLTVEIIDDGPGIAPELADQVFEPFISGRENGTGLGLALVSKIVSDHGGRIALESRPGRTLFRISLPRAPDGAEQDAERHGASNRPAGPQGD